ncbi:hypothetical protein OS493_025843 [Desmophyllum pertusum]|uniref:CUB domain-containing protein n=1 Tax=Desmophyllum pertusum TaxID=174260 RepID=A0A9X0CQ67_9CNID|nr:hypothetical protein OS493_025843 [Desmophyllum pertusum]
MVCTWKITALSNKRIKLYFDNFRLESGLCSSNDYLEVRDGSSSTSLRKGTYCGSSAPPTITSSGRYLWVRFRSDSQTTYRGFQARYEVISKSQSKSSSMVGTVIGVLVGIGFIITIIVIAIYLVKRKNRRVVTTQPLTTTTTVTTNHPPPAGYAPPNPQQYPRAPGPPPLPPPGIHPGPPPPLGPPHLQYGPYNPAPGMAYGAYAYPPQPPGAMPLAQAPPPYYQTEGMKAGPTTVEL